MSLTSGLMVFELESFLTIVAVGGWGGVVGVLLNIKKTQKKELILSILKQVIISSFTALIISMVCLEEHYSQNILLVASGVSGVYGRQLISLMGKKLRQLLSNTSAL